VVGCAAMTTGSIESFQETLTARTRSSGRCCSPPKQPSTGNKDESDDQDRKPDNGPVQQDCDGQASKGPTLNLEGHRNNLDQPPGRRKNHEAANGHQYL
jgi:hypothetical protein